MKLKNLAPRKGQPRSRRRRLAETALGIAGGGLVLFLLADLWLGVRSRVRWSDARQPVVEGQEGRQIDALRYQIAVLLRPRDGAVAVGGDGSAKLIEAALLCGRIAQLEERRGNYPAARAAMDTGVGFLKEAHHPDPTEEHLRQAVARLTGQLRKRE